MAPGPPGAAADLRRLTDFVAANALPSPPCCPSSASRGRRFPAPDLRNRAGPRSSATSSGVVRARARPALRAREDFRDVPRAYGTDQPWAVALPPVRANRTGHALRRLGALFAIYAESGDIVTAGFAPVTPPPSPPPRVILSFAQTASVLLGSPSAGGHDQQVDPQPRIRHPAPLVEGCVTRPH